MEKSGKLSQISFFVEIAKHIVESCLVNIVGKIKWYKQRGNVKIKLTKYNGKWRTLTIQNGHPATYLACDNRQ